MILYRVHRGFRRHVADADARGGEAMFVQGDTWIVRMEESDALVAHY